jgi:hypothetical protein
MGIDRPDWGPPGAAESRAVVPAEPSSSTHSDLNTQPEAGGTDLVPAGGDIGDDVLEPLRPTWEREGGFERNLAQATVASASIEAAVSDPGHLNATIEALPESLKTKMRDTSRMSPQRGGAKAAEAALMSRLNEQELEAYHEWVEALTDGERLAIRAWFNNEYR